MADWLSDIAAFGLMIMGLSALALSQIPQSRRITLTRKSPTTRVLRCGATLLLALSLLLSLTNQGVVMGAVIWTLAITPSGIGVTMILCWYTHQRKE